MIWSCRQEIERPPAVRGHQACACRLELEPFGECLEPLSWGLLLEGEEGLEFEWNIQSLSRSGHLRALLAVGLELSFACSVPFPLLLD